MIDDGLRAQDDVPDDRIPGLYVSDAEAKALIAMRERQGVYHELEEMQRLERLERLGKYIAWGFFTGLAGVGVFATLQWVFG